MPRASFYIKQIMQYQDVAPFRSTDVEKVAPVVSVFVLR